jgi:group I intron endonuclease
MIVACYNRTHNLINVPALLSTVGNVTKVHGGTSMSSIISGVYAIVNRVNSKQYIGSSCNIQDRWNRHIKLLNRGKHHSMHLQNAWNKYGVDNFSFVILCTCSDDELICREQEYLDSCKPEYNVSPTAGRTAGIIRTTEYIAKQKIAQKGKVLSEETRRKISEGMKGKRNSLGIKRVQSPSTIEKIKKALLGHFVSVETREKISSKNKGYKHTEEAKRKIGKASLGNKYSLGRVHSKDERQKRVEALKMVRERNKRKSGNNETP